MRKKDIEIGNYYTQRINKVLYFIDNHLDEKLDLEQLATISHFSQYHFHRIIKAYLGEKKYGVTPKEYRKFNKTYEPSTDFKQKTQQINIDISLEPDIKTISPKQVIFVQAIDAYGSEATGLAWQKIWNFVKENKLSEQSKTRKAGNSYLYSDFLID